jgi:DNA-binding MurR/RpiR family transcriptional regulator
MKCQVLEELEKDGFKGNILSMEHLSTLESFQVIEQIVLALEKTSKILIFSYRVIHCSLLQKKVSRK